MTQPKWKAASGLHFIPYDMPRAPETVDGFTWQHFAITPRRSRGLVLFHLPTGWEISARLGFKSRGQAMKVAQALAPLTDWSRDRDALSAERGLYEKMKAVIVTIIPEAFA